MRGAGPEGTESTGAASAFFERVRLAGDPVADPAAQVRAGDARFTVLTPRLLRLEWAPGGAGEDRATYAFPNRRAEVPPFAARTEGGTTVLDTGPLVLRHTPDGGPLSAANTSIELTAHPRGRWVPGTRDAGNLGGARRTVDDCRGDAALEPGLASRSGWAVVDDSAGVVFGADGWVEARDANADAQDWYFFGHGHDYAGAVADYTRFGGRVPLVPRWILGAWWSRYWAYSEDDVRALVAEFRARDLPLDVFVLDMDWHTPHSWTGYSWNRELFPDPPAFLAWLREEGLRTTLNLHPALGVQAFEDAYPAFAAAMGVDPASREPVPFRIADRQFARHYFELLHHPLEDEGVDFWWIDWQQGRTSELAGLDPLPWLNHLHFADAARRPDRRAVVFSRWGGLGSHRYPIGFSGDSYAQWSALRFQPRYTAAGANVAYGWWSHDIGGHFGRDEPELYVRWVQFGALSPVLRLHSSTGPDIERLPWKFGDEALARAREAFHLRYELLPYLYGAARTASDTGAAMVRPTAWVAPEADGAYLARHQYMLGDALLAAPVVHPAEPATGLATVDVWLPEGEWLERTTGEGFTGPRWVRQVADLARVPQFVRRGTVLPLAEVAPSTARQDPDHLVLSVFPGAEGTARVYEDDGTSSAYLDGRCAWTTVTTTADDASSCAVAIAPAEGDAPGGPRRVTLRLEGTRPPAAVTLDGAPHDAWRHDAATATTVVELPPRPRADAATVVVTADGPLSARGAAHDRAVRAGDLRRLLGDDRLDGDALAAAVRALPPGHPARPAAVARIGGPAIQVIEHTAPDEAATVLGRVIVAAAEDATPVWAEATWRLERGGAVETAATGRVEVAGDAAVFDAPFAWDGTLTPARWAVDVRAEWGDVVLEGRHDSADLVPALPAWRALVLAPADAPAPGAAAADLEREVPALAWRPYAADPSDSDFGSLAEGYVVPLWETAEWLADGPLVAHVATAIDVPDERELAFRYESGAEAVSVRVDAEALEADVTGAGAVPNGTLHRWSRETAPVRLAAGRHSVLFTCEKPAEVPAFHLFLSVRAVDPADGRVALDVLAQRSPGTTSPDS